MSEKLLLALAANATSSLSRFARAYVLAMLAFGGLWAAGVFVNSMQYAGHGSVVMNLAMAVVMAGMASAAAALPVAVIVGILFLAFAK